jgi:entericidin B
MLGRIAMTKRRRVAMLWVAALFISGCNTVQGLGKDIEKGGEAIQRAVR